MLAYKKINFLLIVIIVQNSSKFTKLSALNIHSYSSPITQMRTKVPKKSKKEEKRNTLKTTSPQMILHIQNAQIMWQFPTKTKKEEKPEPPLIYYNVGKTYKQGILELKDQNMTYLNPY